QLRKLATMPRADKFWLSTLAPNRAFKKKTAAACIWLSLFFACGFVGCDRLTSSRYTQLMQDADSKSEQGDFERAINLYEAALDESQTSAARSKKNASKKGGSRTYVVQSGDTLASISRKFYKSSARWEKILDANKENIPNPAKLKVGQTLIIP